MVNLDEIRQQMDLLTDEELIAILREHDEEQWRPEVFNIVASILNQRGFSPDRDLESQEDGSDETEGLNLATVASYNSDIDAETDRLSLEAKGLKAWVFNKHSPYPYTAVQLQVREGDYAAAMQIPEPEPSEMAPSSDLPPEIAEPPCPKCGSRQVMEQAEGAEHSEMQPPHERVWLYHCASCGHKWSDSSESSGP